MILVRHRSACVLPWHPGLLIVTVGVVQGLAGDPVGVLSQQLEDAQSQVTALSPKLAAAEAAVQQQQRHIQQLAADLQQAKGARSAAAERGEVLQVLNVQLQAEVTRLAALAGVHLRDWAGQAGATAADTAMNEQVCVTNCRIATNCLLAP